MTQSKFNDQKFERLELRINKLLDDKRIAKRSDSLIHLFLYHRFHSQDDDIKESFTDGSNDCGIDAVYIDYRSDIPVVNLFQSKVHQSYRKAAAAFKSSSVDKVTRFIGLLEDEAVQLDKLMNDALIQKVFEIRDLVKRDFPDFRVWLLSNGSPCVPHEVGPAVRQLKSKGVELNEFHLEDFVEFCIDTHSPKLNHVFRANESGILEAGPSHLRSIVGYISAFELYHLIKDLRDERKIDYSLFDMNVRGFLGFKNSINKDIFRTASSSENRIFSSLNNGITIVGDKCKVLTTGRKDPKIGIKRMSIVNGAQTCSAIFESMSDKYPDLETFRDLSVLFRIFETDDPNLIQQIAISTNNQNRINSRDLKANDDAQIRLERELRERGIQYVRKRGFLIDETAMERKLDALLAGQLILSFIHHEPDRAKRESDNIFTSDYGRIFPSVSADRLVEAFDWFELIEERRDYIQDEIRIRGSVRTENTFVTYGVFHILMVCSLLTEKENMEDRNAVIDNAIEIIDEQLKSAGNPAYYSFFRNPRHAESLKVSVLQTSLL